MDKTAIKKYAVWARRELISRVSQKAYQYGIRENNIVDANADSIDGKLLTDSEKKERQALIAQVKQKGFEQVMEEVAYTWFNRFSALRFMEVNGYLPTHVRIFTDENNNFKPQIITEAIHLELDGLDMDKVYAYVEADNKDELFKYLLITQCNALNKILPGMFQKISDYTELLFPDNLLREGSVIEQMIALIPQKNWQDGVEIIGWLYQYYNSEPKDKRINARSKYEDGDLPFVTQLFTPDWIVRYIVDNSLGRLWLDGHNDEEVKLNLGLYVDAHSTESILAYKEYVSPLNPRDIKVFDPCMGSAHMLTYSFDVLMLIYESYGYNRREATVSIIQNNLYGLDIDARATQLAYFAIMMKGRQYNRRIFSFGVQPNVYAFKDSNSVDNEVIDYFTGDNKELRCDIEKLIDDFKGAKEFGSVIRPGFVDIISLKNRMREIHDDISLYRELAIDILEPIIYIAEMLLQKYQVVVTNPPYLSSKYMPDNLKNYILKNYSDYKTDLFTAFIVRCNEFGTEFAHIGMLTPYLWMFLSTYEKTRKYVLNHLTISSLVQLEYNAFEAACVPVCCFTLLNWKSGYEGEFIRLSDFKGVDVQEPKVMEALQNPTCGYRFTSSTTKFSQLPGTQFAYWIPYQIFEAFKTCKDSKVLFTKSGLTTGNNDLFLKVWYEINVNNIYMKKQDENVIPVWYFHLKGGVYRKWYGNLEYILHYDAKSINEMKNYPGFRHDGKDFFFRSGATWGKTTTGPFSGRITDDECTFNTAGCNLFSEDYLEYVVGLLNSKVGREILNLLCPSLSYAPGDVESVPVIISDTHKSTIDKLVNENVKLAKEDWDSFETSYGFSMHPLVRLNGNGKIESAYADWKEKTEKRFFRVKENEEMINAQFIEIYGLKDWVTIDVNESDISIYRADLSRDIRSLILYAVGCMFGRYSLDVDGLAYAGGDWDSSKYTTYLADRDNIIPICDDEYFPDDIVGCFVKFIKTVYGVDMLEENLKFIANALDGNGTAREVIRNYFFSEFYTDACDIYSVNGAGKRPVYWMFDSGKNNGFKALIYMHRYQPDTIARMRTDYVHEQQERYRTAITHLQQRINDASTSECVKLNKELGKLKDQAAEIRGYEEKIHHLADQMIRIDLDDGVKHNYEIFKDVLAKIK